MSISEHLKKIFAEEPDKVSALRRVCAWLEYQFDQEVCICTVLGKRWSYKAGSREVIRGIYRSELNFEWGILTDEIRLLPEEWSELCSSLEICLEERQNRQSIQP